jgi:nucleotide-binding universal stress UspA family protein
MPDSFRTILSPIDFDSNSVRALDTAAELARQAGATVVVLHVLVPGSSNPTPAQLDALVEHEQLARERLAGTCSSRLAGVRYDLAIRHW